MHAVVVLVPITVLLLLASAFWRGTHERIGVATPVVAFVTLLFVPLTTNAGEWLRDRIPQSSLVDRHAEMGDGLLPWAAGLFLLASAAWWVRWRTEKITHGQPAEDVGSSSAPALVRRSVAIRAVIGTLAVLISAGAIVQVIRIGDSGAQAAWNGRFSTTQVTQTDR